MSSNDTKRKTTELFFDFTMNDDNDLLDQINKELDMSSALSIPPDASKVKHTKVAVTHNEQGTPMQRGRKTSISIDLTKTEELPTMNLNELVKETEELIGTITETVQETSKIAAQFEDTLEFELGEAAENIMTTKEELPEVVRVATDSARSFELTEEESNEPLAVPTIEQDLRDAYTPHFINEALLQDTLVASETKIKTPPINNESLSAADLIEEDQTILYQTGSFLFNTKDIYLFSQEDVHPVSEQQKPVHQVEIGQTVSVIEMEQITEVTKKINNLERHDAATEANATPIATDGRAEADVPPLVSENLEFGVRETLVEPVDVAIPLIKSVLQTDNPVPEVDAKHMDIDVLLHRLDEISEKEMLHALAPTKETVIEPEVIAEAVAQAEATTLQVEDTAGVVDPLQAIVQNIVIPENSSTTQEAHIMSEHTVQTLLDEVEAGQTASAEHAAIVETSVPFVEDTQALGAEEKLEQTFATDELMNLHEAMQADEQMTEEASLDNEENIDLDMIQQVTNPLDFPDVYFANDGGSVSRSAFHATSTINYATYLDATTAENAQLSSLVNTALSFSDPKRVPTDDERRAEDVQGNEQRSAPRQEAATSQQHEEHSPIKKRVHQAATRQVKPPQQQQEQRATTTTRPTMAPVEVERSTRASSDVQPEEQRVASKISRSIQDDLLDDEAFTIKANPQIVATKQTTNQILVIIVIFLLIVIVALLAYIIYRTLM